MCARILIAAVLCILMQNMFAHSLSAAEPPCGKDILIGEDDTRYYCLPRRVVEDCKAKASGADLDKCVQVGCVGDAGATLKKQRLACLDKNETCLEDRGVLKNLITA